MKPINFKESTKELKKPSSMRDDECASLHVWSDGNQCVSKWKPTLIERIRIAFGAAIWMGIFGGSSQPPVWLDASQSPFAKLSFFNRVSLYLHDTIDAIVYTLTQFISGIKDRTYLRYFLWSFMLTIIFGINIPMTGVVVALFACTIYNIFHSGNRNNALRYAVLGSAVALISNLTIQAIWQS